MKVRTASRPELEMAVPFFSFLLCLIIFCCGCKARTQRGEAQQQTIQQSNTGQSTGQRNETAPPVVNSQTTAATAPASQDSLHAADQDSTNKTVRTSMKNVNFHLTDRIVVHIAALTGKLTPKGGSLPIFDVKDSFVLEVDSASMEVSPEALSNDMNDFVFARPDSPLKKLSTSINGQMLVVKGMLVSKGGLPFEIDGTLSVTPEGWIRVHTKKVKALKLPVHGLMEILGLDTGNVVNTKKVPGVKTDKDDLLLDPQQILPPPQIKGQLKSIRIANGLIALTFGPEGKAESMLIPSGCGAKNYLLYKGGSVRFGRLTMSDTELELIDTDPHDAFDFAIDRYQEQLVAGYTKMTPTGGLCVHMPDLSKIGAKTPTTVKQ